MDSMRRTILIPFQTIQVSMHDLVSLQTEGSNCICKRLVVKLFCLLTDDLWSHTICQVLWHGISINNKYNIASKFMIAITIQLAKRNYYVDHFIHYRKIYVEIKVSFPQFILLEWKISWLCCSSNSNPVGSHYNSF